MVTSAYVKSYDGGTKWMYFLKVIKRKNYIGNKISNGIKKELDSEAIYNKKFLKTKNKILQWWGHRFLWFYGFYLIPKVESNCMC